MPLKLSDTCCHKDFGQTLPALKIQSNNYWEVPMFTEEAPALLLLWQRRNDTICLLDNKGQHTEVAYWQINLCLNPSVFVYCIIIIQINYSVHFSPSLLLVLTVQNRGGPAETLGRR